MADHPKHASNTKSLTPRKKNGNPKRAARSDSERLRRRKNGCFTKASDCHWECSDKDGECFVYMVIKRNNKLYEFNSHPEEKAWPPSAAEIVSI